ncbi:quinone-dependent dihydroorotate dehydrogenase [Sphingomonas sp. 35-24ZXX]|uniref:quinone-dependent dihydroorotate dehydrogenase n=1 Tax=Sphingomonas sp. 35-24ZXX TaxID=1545915 RepID=UPI00053BF920|nr:quinone-dependent dihydroorotate dehydrogenase [Sphingomonas sp. 35-24ZXX]
MLFSIARPALFLLDGEAAHRLTITALSLAPASAPPASDPVLAMKVAGLDFPTPVGLAPGFDKNAEAPHAMFGFGFGFVEIGTVTPLPQAGNPRPRLFRLVEDKAVINRMGFNNDGADAVVARLQAGQRHAGIIGVNIGANKDSVDRIADYAVMTRTMAPLARYLTVNISSPNTPGLRALQDAGALAALLDAVSEARGANPCPVFLKLAPDLEAADIDDITRIAIDKRLDALIVSNTTISRPALRSRHAGEAGGLSGAPLRDLAQQRLRDFRAASGGAIPLIGVGGIASADDAYVRIRAGASLVQLYSALVYEGPGLAAKINRGLKTLLQRDGFATLAEAVGVN